MADKGTGVAITFDTGYFGSIQSLSWTGLSRGVSDITTFATTGGKEFEPADVYDPGELQVDILFAPGTTPHVLGSAAEACTVTFSDSGAGAWAMQGFMSNLDITASDADSRVTASATVKLSGDITITP